MRTRWLAYVGIFGRAGSGKTTLAKRLAEDVAMRYSEVCVRTDSFAAPMKAFLSEGGVSLAKPYSAEVRRLMIDVARRVREYDDMFFVKSLAARAEGMHDGRPTLIIIDDVRYRIEADFILQHGGALIYAYQTEAERARVSGGGHVPDGDPSESEIDALIADAHVVYDGTEESYVACRDLAESLVRSLSVAHI